MNLAHQQPKWGRCEEEGNEEDKAADLKSNHLSISRPGGGYQPQLAEPCSTLYNPFWPNNNISSNNNFVKALLTDHNHCRVYLDRLLRNYCFFSGDVDVPAQPLQATYCFLWGCCAATLQPAAAARDESEPTGRRVEGDLLRGVLGGGGLLPTFWGVECFLKLVFMLGVCFQILFLLFCLFF